MLSQLSEKEKVPLSPMASYGGSRSAKTCSLSRLKDLPSNPGERIENQSDQVYKHKKNKILKHIAHSETHREETNETLEF